MKIIDGKETAQQIKDEIAAEIAAMFDRGEQCPHLVAVLVGEDPASQTYVRNKEKSCAQVGIISSDRKSVV